MASTCAPPRPSSSSAASSKASKASKASKQGMPLTAPSYDEVEPGTAIPPTRYQLKRVDLVKYAGASGAFNIIHWHERVATQVGLPSVTAHAMRTIAQAGTFVT